VQALVGEVEGLEVKYYKPYQKRGEIVVEEMLTPETMSLHLKVGTRPYAKRGKPGEVEIVYLKDELLEEDEVESIIKEILDAVRYEKEGSMEIGERGANVIQLKNMRIAITRPPFSDGLEITVVRPTVKLVLDDYKLSERLKERFTKKLEGLLIAGPPGSGKSTFAASIAEFLLKEKKATIKTLESPRDLQVPKEVTQYGPLNGSFARTADILLLVRPDFTIFDEIRKTQEFQTFTDLRLAGIGMIGVVHASDPIDAVQRFMSRIELGMVPHVIDTIIFINSGRIEKVFDLKLLVKVPTGMTEADLARPVVEVRNFETKSLEYEIYSYGEENVVIPVSGKEKPSPLAALAGQAILREVQKFDRNAEVELVGEKAIVRVDNDVIPKIIGREGTNIKALEKKLGISIDIMPFSPTLGKRVEFDMFESGASLIVSIDKRMVGNMINFYSDDHLVFSAMLGKKGQIKVAKSSDIGKQAMAAYIKNRLKAFV